MYHNPRSQHHSSISEAKFERFEKWLRDNGAVFDMVCVLLSIFLIIRFFDNASLTFFYFVL